MSQQPNSLVNGPYTEYNTTLKDEIVNKDVPTVQQNGSSPQPQQPPQLQQPGAPINPNRPLTRIDSRTSFVFRPPTPAFPTQPGTPVRPAQPRQPVPPNPQQYNQRNPVPGPGPRPPTAQSPPSQNFQQQQQQNRSNYRPVTPFPKAPVQTQQQRPLFQQRSVPAFAAQRPQIPEEGLLRSQTLETAEIDYSKNSDESDHVKAPSMAAMNNRGYSLSSNAPDPAPESKEEARRRSVESLGERPGSRQGSTENLDKKQENEAPSRPESRAASRMNKIVEDEDRSPSSLTDKSADLSDGYASNKASKPQTPKPPPQSPNPSQKSPSPNLQQQQSPGGYQQQWQGQKAPPTPEPQLKTPRPVPVQHVKPPQQVEDEKGSSDQGKPEKWLNLEKPKPKSPVKSEGDNDSGVDESTQGNDPSSNSDNRSPRKSNKSRTSTATPTTARSLSRGSKSPSLKSPDSNATTPGSASEKKKVPMNKVQVGAAPSPNLKVVKSKIGSLDNANYKPGGGRVKIENRKLDFKAAAPRIEAKNDRYIPKGGEKKAHDSATKITLERKIKSRFLRQRLVQTERGEIKKIESVKLDFKEKAKPKVGSKDNIKHQPGGGDVKSEPVQEEKGTGSEKKSAKEPKEIENKKIELNASSKVGSMDNVKHRPSGGEKKIFDDKEYLKQKSAISSVGQSLSGSQNSLPSQPDKAPVADENLNQEH
ncbi:hypothetical protein NQ315_011440 [Exocentrus adspersus]|uniref:Microtubule-associated protein n=1 Tax=Exocentrus adspersus TaxID=1586481 RepID=A0AAV8VUE6_9CUCU|nr:hypothetical protein NQ315_011440 [Exocentrus adspersus]